MKISKYKNLPPCYYKYTPGTYFKYETRSETIIGKISSRRFPKIRRGETIPLHENEDYYYSQHRPYIIFHYKILFFKGGYRKERLENLFWETSDMETKSKLLTQEEAFQEML